MSKSRREFLVQTAFSLFGATLASRAEAQTSQLPPGAPPAFGTAPPVGPPVSASTFAEAEKLVQFKLSPSHRSQAAGNWRKSMAALYERRVGPRKVAIEAAVAPYSQWNPVLPGQRVVPQGDEFIWSRGVSRPLPTRSEE